MATNQQSTIWERNEFLEASEEFRLIRTIQEQIVPKEAEKRVKAANGKAGKYYVYGRPKAGNLIVAKDEEGFNTIVDKVLIGTFDTEEEARAFQNALNRKLAEQNG